MKIKKLRLTKFSRGILIYIFLWILLTIGAGIFVWNALDKYQKQYDTAVYNSNPDLFMDVWITGLTSEELKTNFADKNKIEVRPYEKHLEAKIIEKLYQDVMDLPSNAKFTYEKSEKFAKTRPIYTIKCGEKVVADVILKSDNNPDKFGISGWQYSDMNSVAYEGEHKAIKVHIRVGDELTINDVAVDVKDLVKITDFNESMYETASAYFENIDRVEIYEIRGLYEEPVVKVVDKDGNEIENMSKEANVYDYSYRTNENYEESIKAIAIDGLYKYSEYVNRIVEYDDYVVELLKDSPMREIAYNAKAGMKWNMEASAIEFQDVVIDNVIKYSDTCFQCDISATLVKDLIIYGRKVENLGYTCLYCYIEGKWYLINIAVK